jgi:hypothetical protein
MFRFLISVQVMFQKFMHIYAIASWIAEEKIGGKRDFRAESGMKKNDYSRTCCFAQK